MMLAGSVTYNVDLWQATIQLEHELDPKDQLQTIRLGFSYTLSDGLSGFYRSFYKGRTVCGFWNLEASFS